MASPFLDVIYSADQAERFGLVLGRIAECIGTEFLLTGSAAVEWQIGAASGEVRRRTLNDIDLVAREISPGVTEHFLIHHYHPTREKGNILMQLVDPETSMRV